MSEKEIEEWCDKIISGELPNVAYLTEEEKERIKAFVDNLGEAFKKIVEYLENVFIPAFEDFVKALWDTLKLITANAHSSLLNVQWQRIGSLGRFILTKGEIYIYAAEAVVDRKGHKIR